MKQFVVLLSLFALVLFAGMRDRDPLPLAVDVVVAPTVLDPLQLLDRPTPYTYTATAHVLDAENPRLGYAAAKLAVAPGKHESVTERFNGDHEMTFKVAVSENKDRGATEIVIRRNGRIIHRQKSDFVLQASAVRYRPR
jgi:hypothetical protein